MSTRKEAVTISRKDGEAEDGTPFGAILLIDRGVSLFFTWRYDKNAPRHEQVSQVCDTLEMDETVSLVHGTNHAAMIRLAERALRAHIRLKGLV